MDHFALDRDACTDVVPSRNLFDCQYVAIVQPDVRIRLAGHCFCNGNGKHLARHAGSSHKFIPG